MDDSPASVEFSVDISVDEGRLDTNEETKLADTETRAVSFLRILMFVILGAAAAAVSALVYRFTRQVEDQKFDEAFDSYAKQITNMVHVNLQNKLEGVGALVLSIQTYAITMNRTWPFVTMPFFEESFVVSRSLIGGMGVMLFPIVNASTKEAWEKYSVEN